MKNILDKLDFLNESFVETDFTFLKNTNSYKANINEYLQEAITNKGKIINYISTIGKHDVEFTASQKAFEAINNVINDLSTLNDTLENIEKNILELILKNETSYISQEMTDSIITNIKVEINRFNIFYNNIYSSNNADTIIIENFFNKIYKLDDENSDKSTNINDDDDIVPINDNNILRISERDNKVYLPYSKSEILDFLRSYPNIYKNYKHVINREYVADLTFYNRHPVIARFRETYSLIRDREMKPMIDAFKRSMNLMFRYELNPAIIAGLKSENQLDLYLDCIEKNDLDSFKPFKIIFEVNPI